LNVAVTPPIAAAVSHGWSARRRRRQQHGAQPPTPGTDYYNGDSSCEGAAWLGSTWVATSDCLDCQAAKRRSRKRITVRRCHGTLVFIGVIIQSSLETSHELAWTFHACTECSGNYGYLYFTKKSSKWLQKWYERLQKVRRL